MIINISAPGAFPDYVKAKLAGQRKSWEWFPQWTDSEEVIVQSDKAIGRFDPKTRRGVLNTKGCYFHHLNSYLLGAREFTFPQDFVEECCRSLEAVGHKPKEQ